MIRTFIFWLIVAPVSLAFVLGLLANIAQAMANKITDKPATETADKIIEESKAETPQ